MPQRYVLASPYVEKVLHVPLGLDKEALAVFSSRATAEGFALRVAPDQVWRARGCSAITLVSLLVGPCVDVEWVLLDPPKNVYREGDSSTLLTHWRTSLTNFRDERQRLRHAGFERRNAVRDSPNAQGSPEAGGRGRTSIAVEGTSATGRPVAGKETVGATVLFEDWLHVATADPAFWLKEADGAHLVAAQARRGYSG